MAGLKPGLFAAGQPGQLVSFQSYTMSRAVNKQPGQAPAGQDTPCDRIDFRGSDSRERRPNRLLLSFYDGVI
jgi:hypothetical protein